MHCCSLTGIAMGPIRLLKCLIGAITFITHAQITIIRLHTLIQLLSRVGTWVYSEQRTGLSSDEGKVPSRESAPTSVEPVVLRPSTTSRRVVFPDPDGPMTATSSPGLTYMFTLRSIVLLLTLGPAMSDLESAMLLVSESPLSAMLPGLGFRTVLLFDAIPESDW